LSTHLKDKEEKIQQIIAKLIEESAKGTPIVVEGKKDVETLRVLGVQGTMVTVKTGGKSFLDVVSEVEQLNVGRVVLLLDFDRRGREGTVRLKQDLERLKIKPNVKFWHVLSAFVGKELQCIEGLAAYLENLKAKSSA
jgi:2,5-diamino-6-(ribosylamino)-4(3H)-pyrimidinone 5'-phosphate reductase